MVFGLFKKKDTADLILENAHIFTQNPVLPWAEAVACKDGKIVYLGNSQGAEKYKSEETQVYDLNGKFVYPGFINTHSHPVISGFDAMYLDLSYVESPEEACAAVAAYMEDRPDRESYFGFGFSDSLLEGKNQDEMTAMLDEISAEKPVLLVNSGESVIWGNTKAVETIRSEAREDGRLYINLEYCLQVIDPLDYDDLVDNMNQIAERYSAKGYTSVVNTGAPEFMNTIYQNMLLSTHQEESLKHRYFDSYSCAVGAKAENVLKRLMDKRLRSLEVGDVINCNLLRMDVKATEVESQEDRDNFQRILESVSERNFSIYLQADTRGDLTLALEAVETLRSRGYRKNSVMISTDVDFRTVPGINDMELENVHFMPSLSEDKDEIWLQCQDAKNAEEFLDRLTIDPAIAMGEEDKIGSLKLGMEADMAVFDSDLLQMPLDQLRRQLSDMVIMHGEVVYDVEADNEREMYQLMSGMHI